MLIKLHEIANRRKFIRAFLTFEDFKKCGIVVVLQRFACYNLDRIMQAVSDS
jgi:hypothetical protein